MLPLNLGKHSLHLDFVLLQGATIVKVAENGWKWLEMVGNG
jgi:hypothetical protein